MALYFLIIPLILFSLLYFHYRFVTSKYWSKRRIPHVKPVFLLGNLYAWLFSESVHESLSRYYLENRKKKMVGIWFFTRPRLLVTDQELIKRILIKDFNTFRDRGMEVQIVEIEPLTGHLLMLSGKKWRNLRVKLTPTFTSGKMKMMFPMVSKCAKELREYLRKSAETGETLEMRDLMARYSTDVISSCAFGLEINSLQNPKSEFRECGKKVLATNLKNLVSNIILFVYPKIGKFFKVRPFPKEVSDFFINVVRETVEYRERTQTKRNDFLQLIIQLMRTGKIEDADKTPIEGLTDEEIVQKFSLHEAAAQCFVFFLAGFETSSSALSFALYELALNPDIQKKLQKEIDGVLTECNGEVTYETLLSMEYLHKVVFETLRKYPPVGDLQRKCAEDYYIPEMDVTVEKGTQLIVSVTGIHRDPDIYPEPERFDPERFSTEEMTKREACTFLPFGEGPRNCIGSRFGLMQVKTALFYILSEYNVEVTNTTPIPIKYEVWALLPTAVGGMNLALSKRKWAQ